MQTICTSLRREQSTPLPRYLFILKYYRLNSYLSMPEEKFVLISIVQVAISVATSLISMERGNLTPYINARQSLP